MRNERTEGSPHPWVTELAGFAELLNMGQSGTPDSGQLVRMAAAAVPNGEQACLTVVGVDETVRAVAASHGTAERLGAAQWELREGPCIDAIEHSHVVRVDDLETDLRWPAFAKVALAAGVHGVLAVHMTLDKIGRAALVFYSGQRHAFTDLDLEIAAVFASLAALALQSERHREHAANLEIALESNRHIGTAIGILMARELLTAEQAFSRLRDASQRSHRKVRDVAAEVTRTGQLPETRGG